MPLPTPNVIRKHSGHRLLIFALALSFAGCAGSSSNAKDPLNYTENAKHSYENALRAFLEQDHELSNQLMEEVKRNYGYSRYARLAELRLADTAYSQQKYAEAITMYKSFVHDYPNDAEVPYARYRVARSQFSQASPSVLMAPLEERDLAAVQDSYRSIRAFLADFPNYKRSEDLKYMRAETVGLLARHELYVARFYLRRDNFDAAVARIKFALNRYAKSGLDPEAIVLLGETYLKMKKRDDARKAFEQVLSEHSSSPFSVPTRRFLATM